MSGGVAGTSLLLLSLLRASAGLAQQSPDVLLQEGRQALQAEDFRGAERAFAQLVKRSPTADNFFDLATAEAAAGHTGPAINDLEKSIDLGNRTARARYNLGLLFVEIHQVDAAIEQFRLAIALDPEYLPARYGLGVALMTSGHAAEAAALIEKTMELRPHEEKLWALLVSAQFESGNSKLALSSTKNALQDLPNDARLDVTLATVCMRFQMLQRARELLEDAGELMPNDPEVALLLARASLRAGEPVEALAVLQGMPPEARKGTERLLLMGETRALLGDIDHARDDLHLALNDSPNDPRCMAAYAWLENLAGNYREALLTLSKARALLPKAAGIRYGIALSYYSLGQYPEAEMACDEAIQLDPRYSSAFMVRGLTRRKEKRREAARSDFAKAVELAPNNATFHRELAVALFDTDKAGAAREQLDLALSLNPKDAESYFWHAKTMDSLGDKAKAIADLETAVALKPDYLEAYTELARIYTQTGQPVKSAETLARQKRAGAAAQPPGDDSLLKSLPDSAP